MTIAILIIVNIFMGALLYLIISLKLEKSASEFREKKLRKEMDEIIKEFNATAERNISILENRITILRRLLERTGDMKGLDVTLMEEEPAEEPVDREPAVSAGPFGHLPAREEESGREQVGDNHTETPVKYKKSLLLFTKKVIKSIGRKTEEISDRLNGGRAGGENGDVTETPAGMDTPVAVTRPADTVSPAEETGISPEEYRIEKDLRDFAVPEEPELTGQEDRVPADEVSIEEILSSSEDKYSVISRLHDIGYQAEEIARHSGIPVGEVKLVLNLHNAR